MGLLSLGLRAQPSLLLATSSQPARRIWGFPGQGSQDLGMGQGLYDSSTTYREIFDRAHRVLYEAEQVDLRGLVFSTAEGKEAREAAKNELTRTLHAQPAILASSIAYLEHLKSAEGIGPADHDLVAGHSLGEWTAYVAAGALTLEEGVLAVYWRGRFMEEAFAFDPNNPPMMAILGLETGVIEAVCGACSGDGHVVVPANYNDPGQLVISGHPAAVKEAADQMVQQGARAIPLPAAGPFHTPLMDEVKAKLTAKLDDLGITIRPPTQTIISNVTAKAIESDGDHLASLMIQITSSVRWHESMLEAWRLGARQFVSVDVAEDARGDVLYKFARKIFSRKAPVQVIDSRVPIQRRALFFPADAIQVQKFAPDPETARLRLLRESNNASVISREVKDLVRDGSDEALCAALVVVDNPYIVARDAGLRQLEVVKDREAVAAKIAEYGLSWPAPEARDLKQAELSEKQRQDFSEFYAIFDGLGLVPVEAADFYYYLATRWGGEAAGLEKLKKAFARIVKLTKKKAAFAMLPWKDRFEAKNGIGNWDELIRYVDSKIGFSHPGAMNRTDVNSAVRDLESDELNEEQRQDFVEFHTALDALGLLSLDDSDFEYYLTTRWIGQEAVLEELKKAFAEIVELGQSGEALAKLRWKDGETSNTGIGSWDDLIRYVDNTIGYSHPGVMNQAELERKEQAS